MADLPDKKVLWRCRRGTRELDMLLGRYFERHYTHADADHRRAFQRLLELPDPDVQDLVTGTRTSDDAMISEIIRQMSFDARKD